MVKVRADSRESGAHQFQKAAAVRIAVETLVRAAGRAGGGARGIHAPDATRSKEKEVKKDKAPLHAACQAMVVALDSVW